MNSLLYIKFKSMIQILTKIVERKSFWDSWSVASMGFLFSKNNRHYLLNSSRTQALFFVFIFTLLSSVNSFAHEREPNGKSFLSKATSAMNHRQETKTMSDSVGLLLAPTRAVVDPPVAAKVTLISTNENTPLNGDAKPLVKDIDNPISSLVFTQLGTMSPIEGNFVLRPNGTFTYTPAFNFFGVTSASFKVCDPTNLCDTAVLIITVFSVNDPPIAVDDFNSTVEDTPVSGTVATGDFDSDNLPSELTYSLDGPVPATTGVVVMNPNGTYTYTPALNYTGPAVIKYKVCDPGGLCGMGTLTINFTTVNDPPVATNSIVTTPEDVTKTGDLKPQVSDPDNITPSLVFTQVGVIMDSEGRFTLNPDGTYTFTPAPNFTGTVVVNYTVCDPSNLCATARLTITVSPVNDKPVVTPITPTTTPEDVDVKVCTLISDADAGDTFTASSCGAKNGIVSPVITGSQLCVTYTPNANFNGIDTACVKVCDATGACDTIKIPLVITPVNDAPEVDMPPAISTIEDTPAQVCSTIKDVDLNEVFTATVKDVKNGVGFPTVTGDQLCVAYTPFENFNGVDTVTVIVCDLAGACDTIRIPVTVSGTDDTPVVTPLSISTPEDTPVTACTTINDGDTGNTFTATLACVAKNGTATPSIKNGNELCITYTPNLNFTGLDTVCVKVCDNIGLCETIEVPVVVTPINDRPTIAPLSISTTEETPTTACTTIVDADAGDTFTATQCGVKNGTAVPTVIGNQLCILYTPKANYNGPDTVCVTVCDAANACLTVIFPVTVSPISDKPTVTPTTISTPEETPATVCTPISDGDAGDTFNATLCTGIKNGSATATIKTDATGSQLCVTYTPNLNYNGPDTVCVTVCDQTGLCEVVRIPVVVTPVNDPPTVNPTSIATAEETPATVVTTINDIDLDDTFTATLCGVKNGSATLTVTGNQLSVLYTPKLNYSGVDTVCVTVCDAVRACTTVNIPVTVSPINDKPTVTPTTITTPEDTQATICTAVTDVDGGDTFTAVLCTGVKNGTATATMKTDASGTQVCVTYTPTLNYNGVDTVCVTVCDAAGACETVKIPVVVTPVNDKPTVTPTSIATVEDIPATVCTLINDVDAGEAFTFTPCGVKNGKADISIVANQLCVIYTPNLDYNGLDTVCVNVCDLGGLCETVKIPVEVAPISDKPFVAPTRIVTPEDTPATVCTTISDSDVGEVFSVATCGDAKNGTAVPTITGSKICVLYTPNANYNGPDTACFRICDLAGNCDTLIIPITVTSVNDNPKVVQTTSTVLEDKTINICTIINDADLGETFTVTKCGVKNGTADATITGNQICVNYVPKENYNGLDTLCFVVCDAAGTCDSLKIPVTVTPVNDKPIVVQPTNVTGTLEDTPVKVCTTINDVDVNETFNATFCGAKNGTATAVITGNEICVNYIPIANFNGADTVCFVLCDAGNACDTLKIPVFVTSVNDKPKVDNPLSISTLEDKPVSVCTTVSDNDKDAVLTVEICGAQNGIAFPTLTGNQLCIAYTPLENYNGLDTVCVLLCDEKRACDTVKIPVIIQAVNDAPVVNITTFEVLKDSTRQFCYDVEDPDMGDKHTFSFCGIEKGSAVGSISNGKLCITYTAPSGYIGADSICVILCDSSNACIHLNIPVRVFECNDLLAPVMTCPAKIEVSIMGTVLTDPNNFISKVSFSDNCDGLKFDFNNLKATDDCGTPFIRQISGLTSDSVYIEGKHFMRFEAVDVSGKKTPCQVEIEVSPINLVNATQMSVCPNESLKLQAKTYNGATYKWTGPRNVSVDSILLAIPRTAGESEEVFTVGATFGACTFKDSITVTFRIRPVLNDDLFKVAMNTELKNSVLVNDTTITLQKYTVKLDKPVADGKVAFNNDGTFTFNPSNNFTGTEIFTYQVCPVDCPNTCETATATVKVANSKFANKGTNVITPNNDGLNDALEIEGLDPNAVNNQSEIVVYNQWGNVVYRATSYKNDWKGTFNNNPLPVGTYYFLFKKSPDAVPVKDFVTIIR
jgi:gliding motility-associated-like protein